MTINAVIIADSINQFGQRLTTFQLRYPRFIHAEELTHRLLETTPEMAIYEAIADGFMYDPDLSRNASSSRAVPIKRMIEDLRRDPVIPSYWGSHKPGMQAGAELYGEDRELAEHYWLQAMESAIDYATRMNEIGLHKQIANRILEPWAHINVVVTATEFQNFYALRCHKDAQPEIKDLAEQMKFLQEYSSPKRLNYGQWHLPYTNEEDRKAVIARITANGVMRIVPTEAQIIELLLKVSVARCARVSYMTFEGKDSTIEEDIELYNKLVVSQPLHASPAEHQATPDLKVEVYDGDLYTGDRWEHPAFHANFVGWQQHRKMLPGEYTPG